MFRQHRFRRLSAIVPLLLAATVMASCVTARESPSSAASASASPSPSLSSTTAPSITAPARPSASSPAAGKPWGGLVITAAEPARSQQTVWEQTEYRGRTYGFVAEPSLEGGSKWALVEQSSDGSWTRISSEITGTYGGHLAASDSVIVALQNLGRILECKTEADGLEYCSTDALRVWTSADGAGWTPAGTLPGSGNLGLGYLTWGPAGFMAGTEAYVGGHRVPVMWISKDGATWRKATLSSGIFADANIDDVAVVPGGYVATGGIGRVEPEPGYMGTIGGAVAAWWSTDGEHWARSSVEVPKGGAQVMCCPIYVTDGGLFAGGYLYTAGDNGDGYVSAAWTSTDNGRTWRYHATDTAGDDRESFVPEIPVPRWALVASDGHRLVSVTQTLWGESVTGVWESFDGSSWRQLRVEGLDYLNGTLGAYSRPEGLSLDDSGVTLWFEVGEQHLQIRAWAVP